MEEGVGKDALDLLEVRGAGVPGIGVLHDQCGGLNRANGLAQGFFYSSASHWTSADLGLARLVRIVLTLFHEPV